MTEFEKARDETAENPELDIYDYNGYGGFIQGANWAHKWIHNHLNAHQKSFLKVSVKNDALINAITETINNFNDELSPFTGSTFDAIEYQNKFKPISDVLEKYKELDHK